MVVANCILCIFGNEALVGQIIGIPSFNAKCRHMNGKSEYMMETNQLFIFCGVVVCFYLILDTFYHVYYLLQALNSDTPIYELVTMFTRSCLCLKSTVTIIILLNRMDLFRNVLQSYHLIVGKWFESYDEYILKLKIVKRFRKFLHFLIIHGIIYIVVYVIFVSIIGYIIDDFLFPIQRVAENITFYVDNVAMCLHLIIINIIRVGLKQNGKYLMENLSKHLINRNGHDNLSIIKMEHEKDQDFLVNYIGANMKMYIGFVRILKEYADHCHPLHVIWLLITEMLIVVNFFFYGLCFYNGNLDFFKPDSIEGSIQLLYSGLLLLITVNECHNLQSGINELKSYLYKYPISKLSTAEASQLEMYLKILSIHKPVLRASSMFNVELSLLGSILGFVVTYVLVVLQFYISFMDDNKH